MVNSALVSDQDNRIRVRESDAEDVSQFAAPFLLKVGAALIDYIVLLVFPILGLLSEKIFGPNGLDLVTDRTLWLYAALLAGANCVILPLFTARTLGKAITGIQIVRADGKPVEAGKVIFRQTVGYVLTLATFCFGFFLSAVNSSGRSLHDLISGTMEVRASRRLVRA